MRPVNDAVKTLLALVTILPGLALAENAVQAQVPTIATSVPKAAGISANATGLGATIDNSKLNQYRGGSDIVNNTMNLSGAVKENIATNVVTGTNSIANGAFSNASGIPTVVQNSGNNVLIQAATIVNVQFK